MTKNIGCNEVLEMALQIEQVGHDFYRTLAFHSAHPHLKEAYRQLAAEEQEHIRSFNHLRHSLAKIDVSKIPNWNELALYFSALLDTNVLPTSPEKNSLIPELKDEIGAIHVAISFEKDTILFLQEMRHWVNDEDQKKIGQLIEEERGHILRLLDLKKRIAPA